MQKVPYLVKLIRIIALSSFFITFISIFLGVFLQEEIIFFFVFPMFFITFISFIAMFVSNLFISAKQAMENIQPINAFGGSNKSLSASFNTLATQAGYTVTLLDANHPSGAQYVLDHPTGKLLVKVLNPQERYSNTLVQNLSGSLLPLQAKEGWIVSMIEPFKENDESYARFYNVLLYTMNQAVIVLGTKS